MVVADERAEKTVELIFHRLGPSRAQELADLRAWVEIGKAFCQKQLQQVLVPAEFFPAVADAALLVFDNTRQIKKPDHRGMWVNFCNQPRRLGVPFPPNLKAEPAEPFGDARRPRAFGGIGRVARCVLAVKKAMREPIHRPGAGWVRADDWRVDEGEAGGAAGNVSAHPLRKLFISIRMAKGDNLSTAGSGVDEADAVAVLFAPSQIDTRDPNLRRSVERGAVSLCSADTARQWLFGG